MKRYGLQIIGGGFFTTKTWKRRSTAERTKERYSRITKLALEITEIDETTKEELLQAEVTRLQEQLKDANEALSYYKKFESWTVSKNRGVIQEIRSVDASDVTEHYDAGYRLKLGGKRAREYFSKWSK